MLKLKYKVIDVKEFDIDKKYMVLENDAIGNHIQRHGYWENHISEFISKYVKEGDCCLDIGANFGYHTVTLANTVGNAGKVHSFEPMRIFNQLLNANICVNGLSNVATYNFAIGEVNSVVRIPEHNYFQESTINYGDTSINLERGNKVTILPLDELTFDKLNFIKMDIQGVELMALRGAKNLIKTFSPLMIIEVEDHQMNKFGYTRKELFNFIVNELGYDIYVMNNEYPADHICVPVGFNIVNNFETFELKKVHN